jgi:hypothetical protein
MNRNTGIRGTGDVGSALGPEAPPRPLSISKSLAIFMVALLIPVALVLARSPAVFGSILAVACAAGMAGAALGFLFGIPRSLGADGVAPAPRPAPDAAGQTGGVSPVSAGARQAAPGGYLQNTNLEQISDWLTKIVVGVGLVEFKSLLEQFERLSGAVAKAWALDDGAAVAGAIMLSALIAGFMYCYVWTRTEFIAELQRADDDRNVERYRREQAEAMTRNVIEFAGGGPAMDTTVAVAPAPAPAVRSMSRLFNLKARNASSPAPADAMETAWDRDDNKGQFGGSALVDGVKLEAVVEPLGEDGRLCGVTLRVRAQPGAQAPTGRVTFHLHPTFNQPVVEVPVSAEGVAELRIIAAGAFTVGAVLDPAGTRLELDLKTLPGIPPAFRDA